MANDLNLRLRIRVSNDGTAQVLGGVNNDVRRLGQSAATSGAQMQSLGDRMTTAARNAVDLRGALTAAAAGLSIIALYTSTKDLINYADSLKLIDSRVKVATQSAADYATANQALLAVSLATHSSLAENANLFARTNKAIEQMGGTVGNTIAFTDLLAKSLKISGAAQAEAASVTRQMSQAFASGVLRGDEFNSIMENGSRLAFALADGLSVGVGELRKMAEAGELTAPKVLQATLSQAERINAEFKQLPVTVAAAMTDVETQFGRYINATNTANGTTSNLAAGVGVLAQNLPGVLDVLVLIGEGLVLALVSKGVSSLGAFGVAQTQAIRISMAHSDALAINRQMNVAAAQARLVDVNSLLAQTDATIAATQAEIRRWGAMAEGTALTRTLTAAEAQRATLTVQQTAATQTLTAAQQQLNAANVGLAASFRGLNGAVNALNVVFVALMAVQIGRWLNETQWAADRASESIGLAASMAEQLRYIKELSTVDVFAADRTAQIDQITAAHERNRAAIADNVQGSIEWRAELVRLRNEFERMTELSEAPFKKIMDKFQDQKDKLTKTELQYTYDKEIKEGGVTDPIQKRLIYEQIAATIKLREEKEAAAKAATAAHKSAVKEAKDEQKEIDKLLKHYDDITLKMREEIALNGDSTKASALQFEIENTRMDAIDPKYRALLESKQLLALQTASELDNQQLARKEDALRVQALDSLIDKYKQLTLSAKDYALWKLTPQHITPDQATPAAIGAQFDQNTSLENTKTDTDKARQSLESYANSLDSANGKMQDFGSIAASSLDGALGGVSAVAGAFANMLAGIDENAAALDALRVKQQALQDFKPADPVTDPDQYAQDIKLQADLQQKFAAEQAELTAKSTQLQLAGFGQIAGAAKGLFDEQSTGYKALQAAEQTFRAFEMAAAFEAFLSKQGFLLSWLGIDTATKATATATETAFTATSVAESGVRATAYGTAAYANTLASVPFPFNLVAGAAVLAALVAAGVSIFGGSGGYTHLAEDRQKAQGAGTVLGDVKAQSDSIGKALDDIRDADLSMLPLTGQMAQSLRNIEGGINGLSVFTSQRMVGDGSGLFNLSDSSRTNNLGQLLSGESIAGQVMGGIGAAISGIGLIEGVGNLILGTITASLSSLILPGIGLVLSLIPGFSEFLASGFETQHKVRDQGINLPDQTLGQLRQSGLEARAYADIETIDHVFWIETSRSLKRRYQSLSQTAIDSMTDIITGLVDTVADGGQLLGMETTQLQQRLDAFVLSIGDVSLHKLKGEDLTKALNAAFSKAGDQLAGFVVPGLDEFQQQNEGLLQTLVRVATGVEQARVGLQSLAVRAIDYTDIINQQGDVFEETVRQSIVAVEQLNGTVNGVGQIIDALSGSGTDLLGIYQQLLDVRKLMTATGLNGGALDATLIGSTGGLDVLTSGLETFKDKFFSEEQRFNASTREMTDAFAALNLALPASRDGFRDLVLGIDTSTAAGRTLLGQVTRLIDGFDKLSTQAETMLAKLNDNITNAYNTAADLLKNQVDSYRGIAESLTKYSDSLISNVATNSPYTQYAITRDKFFDLKKVLATGTEAEKLTALGQLQDVAGAFDSASRAFNKSGMGYIKDQASIQGVLASAIGYSTTKADVAQSQLDTLKDQLRSLGLLQEAVTDVKTAVVAVGIAIAGLDAFKQAQQQSQALSANQAAFNQIEDSRKTAYDATIAAMSRSEDRATTGARIQQAAAVRGYVNTSKHDFSVAAAFNPATGANTSVYDGYTGGGKAGDVWAGLTGADGQFERIRNLVSNTARTLTGIIGGALPDVRLTVAKAGTSYAFADKKAFYAGDTVDSLLLGFAQDAAGYLADQTGRQDWITQVKAVPFNSLAAGLSSLADTVARLKQPYQAGEYDPAIDYRQQIDGSHRDGLDRVPYDGYIAELHQGERISTRAEADRMDAPLRIEIVSPSLSLTPTTAQPSRDDADGVAELRAIKKELEALNKKIDEQNRHAEANVAAAQAGFKQVITWLQKQVAVIENEARGRRIKESVHG